MDSAQKNGVGFWREIAVRLKEIGIVILALQMNPTIKDVDEWD